MNVNDIYRICQFAINKDQGGYLPPSDFNLTINQAQDSYENYLLGEFQQYQIGRAQAMVNYSQNENIRQRLTPLIAQANLTIDSNGVAPYPTNFLQVDAMFKADEVSRIRFVQQERLYSNYSSQIDPIATNPIYLLESGQFQFYPKTLGAASVSYVKSAPDIVWAYTTVSGRPVYNSATSVQPVWADVDLLEIIARALKIIGVNLQMGQVEQYANQVTNQGQ
jgi:hypothetical protein